MYATHSATRKARISRERYHPVKPHTSIRFNGPGSSPCDSSDVFVVIASLAMAGSTRSVTSIAQYGVHPRNLEDRSRDGVTSADNGRWMAVATSAGEASFRIAARSMEGSGWSSE